jgi:Abortive infection alpha
MVIEKSKAVVETLAEAIKAAAGTNEAKAAAKELGKAAVTAATFINNCLLPIAALNYGIKKAEDYFKTRFQADMAEKLKDIPQENLIEPKATIAGPALQGLAFSHEEPNLKSMYLELLAGAMDSKRASSAHPAFAEIIGELTSEEADIFREIVRHEALPIGLVKLEVGPEYFRTLYRHLLSLQRTDTGEPYINENLPSYVDNWIRLGLVEVSYLDIPRQSVVVLPPLHSRPEFLEIAMREKARNPAAKLSIQRGTLSPTAFGLRFAKACGLLPPESPADDAPTSAPVA